MYDRLGGIHRATDHKHPQLRSKIEDVVFELRDARTVGIRMEARER